MKKRGRNLIVSVVVTLLFGTLTFPIKTINGAVISNNLLGNLFTSLQGWFLFSVLCFMSIFLVLNVASSGVDSLQKRLGEMEEINPSSQVSKNSRRGLIQKLKDKYFLSHRNVTEYDQDKGKYMMDSNYTGNMASYADPRVVEYYLRTHGNMPIDKGAGANEYFNSFLVYSSQFNKELEKFPKADREKIIASLKSQKEAGVTPISLQKNNPLHKPKEILSTDSNFYKQYGVAEPSDAADSVLAVRLGRGLPYSKSIRTPANDLRVGKYAHEKNRAKNGRSSYESLKSIDESEKFNPRQAVHFTLNGIYTGKHRSYDWAGDKVDHILLAPVKQLLERRDILYLNENDSASFGDLPIPKEGSEIIISSEQYKSMSPKEINRLKRRTGAEIVTVQSMQDKNVLETAKRRIQERGYFSPQTYTGIVEKDAKNLFDAVQYLGNVFPVRLADAESFSPNKLAAELSRVPWLKYRMDSLKSGRPAVIGDLDIPLRRELKGVVGGLGEYFDRTIFDLEQARRGNPTYQDITSLEKIVKYADAHGASEVVPQGTRDYITQHKKHFEFAKSKRRKAA